MSTNGSLQVLDGTQLLTTASDFSLPSAPTITGAQILEATESTASTCLFGLPLPDIVKSSALGNLNLELDQAFEKDQADALAREYLSAISHILKDDPLVVSVLDGNTIRLFLEDEDDFAMLAENLFTDLDTDDEGKISKSNVKNALVQMGVEMGVPPLADIPMLNDIIKKYGAEGDEKLGQAQFAELLQPILQDIADALALKHVTVLHDVKIVNGSKLRKLLADGHRLEDVIRKIQEQKPTGHKQHGCTEVIRSYLEKNAKDLGLPPPEDNEVVILLYDAIFSDLPEEKRDDVELDTRDLGNLVKQILGKFAEELEANPLFVDSTT